MSAVLQPLNIKSDYFEFKGGLNLVDPPMKMGPSFTIGAENYECGEEGGYRRSGHFERFDGRRRPSDASYWVLNFDAGDTAISEGDLVGDGASPTVQGEALIDAVVSSGSWAGADAAGYVVLMAVSGKTDPGSFADDDALYVGAAQVATANGTASERGASTDADDTTWYRDAVTTTRADIDVVPGSGVVRGVAIFNDNVYAFRNNSGGTACVMHKATTAGWVEQDLGRELSFTSGGTYVIAENDGIEGATGGATATVKRVILTSGSWAGGDAAGRLILYSQTGTFQSENLDVGANANVATIAGDSTVTTLGPDGRFEFVVENFKGSTATIRLYGVDGVSRAFEWDGSVFVPLTTGMTTDAPTHLEEHKKHLFLTFPGGSVQNSDTGDPYGYSLRSGANEFGTGYETVGLHGLPGGVLGIWDRNRTYVLSGSSNSDWALNEHSDRSGAIEWSIQRIGMPVYADDRGITNLDQVQYFGDFRDNVIADEIRPYLQAKKDLILSSAIRREKNQYRLFFSDGTALFITFKAGKVSGAMPIDYGVKCHCAVSEEISGTERIFVGADDGYVYELDRGTSADGSEISAFLRMAFWHFKSPETIKNFIKASLEVDCAGDVELQYTAEYDYGSADIAQARTETLSFTGGGGRWNVDDWNDFIWSEADYPMPIAELEGEGVNMGFLINSEATWEEPHTIFGATVDFVPRRKRRY